MIPSQYINPGSLIYGVPLIQSGEIRPIREKESKPKNPEKWEGVLSPSEVDAKVQQILASPQKGDEGTDKEGSPKKRKRQQSAPHMYDRYPGNPALRFQTSTATKALKLSKSETQLLPQHGGGMKPGSMGPMVTFAGHLPVTNLHNHSFSAVGHPLPNFSFQEIPNNVFQNLVPEQVSQNENKDPKY